MTQTFPLRWPHGRPRKSPAARRDAAFGTRNPSGLESLTLAQARDRLQAETDLLRATAVVLSTDVALRLDGLPKAGQADPADPGVALSFDLAGRPHVLACDTFRRVPDNIAALAAHIAATRRIERLGVATAAEMFAGFRALPGPGATPWWRVLGLQPGATADQIEAAFRALARERHPDRPGGSDAMMADLNRARDEALTERGHGADA